MRRTRKKKRNKVIQEKAMKRMGLFMIAACAAAGVLFAFYSLYSTNQAIYVAVDGNDQNKGQYIGE